MPDFKDVDGYPGYMVSSDGYVWSFWRLRGPLGPVLGDKSIMRKLKPCAARKNGPKIRYATVNLFKDGVAKTFPVHRIVAEAFCGPCPASHECAHENGDHSDNRAENLRWATRAENCQDKIGHGTSLAGEKHNLARLSRRQVIEIYNRYHNGESSIEIAKDFPVEPRQIRSIGQKRKWQSVLAEMPDYPPKRNLRRRSA